MTHSPFAVRGVVEGFYGVFYTPVERNDLIRFLAQHGYNLYVYGPKNDQWHRNHWWEPYPPDIMEQFAMTVGVAREVGLRFCYAICPGLTICYASEEAFGTVTDKLRAFYDLGVRAFSLLLDDIPPVFHCEADQERYRSYGEAHADLSNRLYEWLQSLDTTCTLSMCPTSYHGVYPFDDYLHELGAALHPNIDIFYTGPEVCSPTIGTSDVAAFAKAVHRPPLLWDNYPVNDLAMAPEMHIGPIRGRDPSLGEVARGILVNPMNQPEASKIPLLTYADFLSDPQAYNPAASWERALRAVGDLSYGALRRFAEGSLHSCLGTPEASALETLVDDALRSLRGGEPPSQSAPLRALERYILDLRDASYNLKNRMTRYALRADLLPWIELVDNWVWMTKRAFMVLRALEQAEPYEEALERMEHFLHIVCHHHKRWGGALLIPFAEYVQEQANGRA